MARPRPLDSGAVLLPAAMAHADAIAALHKACFDEPWTPFTVRQVMAMAGAFGLIAVPAEGRGAEPDLYGFALARAAAGECELLSLAVAAERRGHGLGGALLAAAVAEARTRAVTRVFLEVAEDNWIAQRLYRDAGFRPVGRRPGYYRRRLGAPMAALTLSLDL